MFPLHDPTSSRHTADWRGDVSHSLPMSSAPDNPLDARLNAMEGMVVAFDDNGRVIGANQAARQYFSPNMLGQLAGDVINCYFSQLPGGCGKTGHCDRCPLRHVITLTITEQHAFTPVRLPWRSQDDCYTVTVSTQPRPNMALIRIHNLTAAG